MEGRKIHPRDSKGRFRKTDYEGDLFIHIDHKRVQIKGGWWLSATLELREVCIMRLDKKEIMFARERIPEYALMQKLIEHYNSEVK